PRLARLRDRPGGVSCAIAVPNRLPMSASDPLHALAAGAVAVTPNNRLARALTARHDAAMRRAGKSAWPAARVLPWDVWLTLLWREAGDAGMVTQRLLAPVESEY